MRIIALKCDQCGAPLDVPVEREQLTCPWCGSMLHVSHLGREATAASESTERAPTREQQAILTQIEKLDAEWEAYRAEYLPRDDAGEYVIPEPEACRMGAWLTGIACVAVAVFGVAAGALGWSIFALVIGVVVIFILLRQARIAPGYQRSLQNYQTSRRALLDQLPSAESRSGLDPRLG